MKNQVGLQVSVRLCDQGSSKCRVFLLGVSYVSYNAPGEEGCSFKKTVRGAK